MMLKNASGASGEYRDGAELDEIVTDWYSFLDKSSPIPTDVVIDVRETVKLDDGTLEVVGGKIECHRLLLASANGTFRSLFYGPMHVEGDTVVVKDTTFEAFSVLIQFIYDFPNYLSPEDGLEKLFKIRDIAERFRATRLVEEVAKRITEFPMKNGNYKVETSAADEPETARQDEG